MQNEKRNNENQLSVDGELFYCPSRDFKISIDFAKKSAQKPLFLLENQRFHP